MRLPQGFDLTIRRDGPILPPRVKMEAMTKFRVAVGGFMHETNTFAPSKAGLAAFEHGGGWPELSRGPALVEATRNVNMGICGFIGAAQDLSWQILPTLWCAASPSAHVTEEAYEAIAGEIVAGVAAAGRLDGVYLDLHGAMVAEHLDDGEGELLARVRRAIGPSVPLVASLDLHANLTPLMAASADVLVAYRTYPHVDMAATGRRAARHLAQLMGGGERWSKALRQLPFLIPISWQCTTMEPANTIFARLAALEGEAVPTLSFAPGFPAADFAHCGPAVMAYGRTQADADRAADTLTGLVCDSESAFAGTVHEAQDGVRHAMAIARAANRPVVIADTQDNPGAGGNSDTTGMLRALLAAGARKAAIGLIVDPDAARSAHEAGEGRKIAIALGGRSGVAGDAPFEGRFVVEKVSSGRLVAPGPFYGGSRIDLGPSACLRIDGVRIVVASRKAQLADQEMYRFVGIEPTEQSILVNKSSVHFRADFEPIAEAILICAAPGPMPADPSILPWRNLRPGIRLKPNGPVFNSSPLTAAGEVSS
jgi:microcystin degradation protein MlrC